jgi:putative acetyltransferase
MRQTPEHGGNRATEPAVVIRQERPGEAAEIAAIIAAAFEGHPHSQGREASIVAGLRRDKALVISLVAQTSGGLAGHIAFSRVVITGAGGGWYGLGPLAVPPALQKRGIGQLLVLRGLEELRTLGAKGCVLLGDQGYYGRFGFRPWPGLVLEGAPTEHVLGLPLGKDEPEGEIAFHSAFYEAGPQAPVGSADEREAR